MYQDFSSPPSAEGQGEGPAATESGSSAGAFRPRWRLRWRAILREPLAHFLIAGILIFAVSHWLEERSKRYVIDVTAGDVQRIANSYVQQYGALPTPGQLRTMIGNYVREEIYLREGLTLGLDKDDEIVRRRVAQKFDFLQQDMAVPREPSEAALHRWFDSHRALYAIPARRSFDHLYFAIDQRGEAAAKALADKALAALRAGGTAPAGDTFPGPGVIRLLSQPDTNRLFGGSAFAKQVFTAPAGQWAGPFRSGFGWHLVRVSEAEPSHARGFDAAKADALIDWREADRQARNNGNYEALLKQYRVTVAGPAQ
jgi:hypothetical protein